MVVRGTTRCLGREQQAHCHIGEADMIQLESPDVARWSFQPFSVQSTGCQTTMGVTDNV